MLFVCLIQRQVCHSRIKLARDVDKQPANVNSNILPQPGQNLGVDISLPLRSMVAGARTLLCSALVLTCLIVTHADLQYLDRQDLTIRTTTVPLRHLSLDIIDI